MIAFKLSGAGNDFVALAEPEIPPTEQEIRAWCRRGLSLGADGVITLVREPDHIRMRYFNSDGGCSDLCLNGTRCAARLAIHLGWAGAEGRLTLATDVGKLGAREEGNDRISLELPHFETRLRALVAAVDNVRRKGWRLDVGVPHFVLEWPKLGQAPVSTLGAALRSHPAMGKSGANVSFVEVIDSRSFGIRTFERGVEAETLACGTGVVAATVALEDAGLLAQLDRASAMTLSGATLTVSRDESGLVQLAGDARIVARCELLPGARKEFTPPAWLL